jgi:hypothetical protein
MNMKVQELIDILSEQDPDAEVLIQAQSAWPFEHRLHGVTTRAELTGDDDDDLGEGPADSGEERPASSDVFLVEGSQLRYGNKDAWNIAQR